MLTTAQSDSKSGKVVPADLSPASPVYALGSLSFDFGTIQRRDVMFAANGGRPILTNADVLQFLTASPVSTADFESIIWTLVLDGAPVYALRSATSRPLTESGLQLVIQLTLADPTIDLLAVPGILNGTVTLLDGRVVPVIDPDVRGIQSWSSAAVSQAVGLTGAMALPGTTAVNLTSEGSADWASFSQLAYVHKSPPPGVPISALTVLGAGGTGLITVYSGSTVTDTWTSGTPVATSTGSTTGSAVSAAAGGLAFTAPADTSPRTLRVYARTFAATGRFSATLSDDSSPGYIDTSFSAFPSISGLPGVVDGIYTIVYQAGSAAQTLTVSFIGTPVTARTPNPLSVTLFQNTGGAGATQTLGVGVYAPSAVTLTQVGSVFVPPGLRLSIINSAVAGSAFTANVGTTFTNVPGGPLVPGQNVIVEPENYVGFQSATLQLAPLAGNPLLSASLLGDFMDRVYYLLRNPGVTPEQRAINFAATQLAPLPGLLTVQTPPNRVLANALAAGLDLESIAAAPAIGCRPGSGCWDVSFSFFDPRQVTQAGRTVVRLTVDISNVRPVVITPARTWTSF